MDSLGYRISGELPDITVVVDGEEFNLHKFPLFVRSNYFKNISSTSTEYNNVSRIVLENFPGGPRIFDVIADYCYNKEIQVNYQNVIQVRCAAEYLEMTGGVGRGGLAMLAENILFDLIYSAKSKRDYSISLLLLENASTYSQLSEKCGLSIKLIDSFVDNLTNFIKTSTLYDSIYDKSSSTYVTKKKLHHTALDDNEINILNNLNLKWINELVRSAVKYGLNQNMLSFIIQNYIDYNTGLNPYYKQKTKEIDENFLKDLSSLSKEEESYTFNLIKMAGDILKVEKNFNELADENKKKPTGLIEMTADIFEKENSFNASDQKSDEENNSLNLIKMAGDILKIDRKLNDISDNDEKDEPSGLLEIAGDIFSKDNRPTSLLEIAGDIFEKENSINMSSSLSDEEKNNTINLIKMAGDILKLDLKMQELSDEEEEKPAGLLEIADDIFSKDNKPTSLVKIAGDILEKEQFLNDSDQKSDIENNSLNLKNMAGDILKVKQNFNELVDEDKPTGLLEIAGDIFDKENKPSSLIDIAGDVLNQTRSNLINIFGDILKNQSENDSKINGLKTIEKSKINWLNQEEKLKVIHTIFNMLIDLHVEPEFSISWFILYMSNLENLNAEDSIKSKFQKWTWKALNNLKNDSNELTLVPPSVMIQLIKENLLKDFNSSKDILKLIDLTDKYLMDLQKEEKLDLTTFFNVVTLIPKEKRISFDNVLSVMVNLLEKDNSTISPEKQEEIISIIDFSKVNEKTLEECKSSIVIPSHYVTDTALTLCAKLRKELDEANLIIKSLELKNRPLGSRIESSNFTSSAYASKYSKTSRNRSNEHRNHENRYSSVITNQASTSSPKTTNYSSSFSSGTNNYSYTSLNHNLYSTSSTLGKPISTSVLNSSYKATNFNPTINHYIPSHHNYILHSNYEPDEIYYDYEPIYPHYLDIEACDYYPYTYNSKLY